MRRIVPDSTLVGDLKPGTTSVVILMECLTSDMKNSELPFIKIFPDGLLPSKCEMEEY